MKFTVYYRVPGGTSVNRDYPEYDPVPADVKAHWAAQPFNRGRIYLQHEPHDDYTAAYAAAGMIGKPDSVYRPWLSQRVTYLEQQAAAAVAAKRANVIAASHSYGPLKPGDMTVDQNGRRGRVPNVPLEVFRDKPIDPENAHKAVQDMCKGGGGTIPRSS